jgi:uncharacterized protein YecA (UPF0149 family)
MKLNSMNERNEKLPNALLENNELCCNNKTCCPPKGRIIRDSPKVGRNDPCICGNGRKFKKCCGKDL